MIWAHRHRGLRVGNFELLHLQMEVGVSKSSFFKLPPPSGGGECVESSFFKLPPPSGGGQAIETHWL